MLAGVGAGTTEGVAKGDWDAS